MKIGVLLYSGCVFYEVAAATELMSHFGSVDYFTPDGREIRMSNGVLIRPQGSYEEMESVQFSCVLIPGGNPDSIVISGSATAPLIRVASSGAVIGGICAGVLVMASAGLLKGVRATHNYTIEHAPIEVVEFTAKLWKGMEFVRADVVADGKFVTAQPWASVQFAAMVAQTVGAMSEDEAKNYIQRQKYTYDNNRQ